MSRENASYRDQTITTATKGTPCGWVAYGETGTRLTCKSGKPAAHVLLTTLPIAKQGTALCAVHSPFDLTDAEREILDMPFQTMGEAGADRMAAEVLSRKLTIGDVLVDVTPEGTARVVYMHLSDSWISGTDEVTGESVSWRPSALLGWLESGTFMVVCDGTVSDTGELKELRTAEVGQSGTDVLADLLAIGPEPQPQAARVIKFHKLSAPMIGVLAEVARSRGLVGAWAMRNVVVKGVKGATMRTVTALINRGILADEVNEGDQSGTGGLQDYVLTERGAEIAEVIGCPVVHLPTDPEVIAALVAIHDQGDCATGCEVIIARGMVLLPAGGDVCFGCGSVFTRPSGQLHPSIDVISGAVVSRNHGKGK